MRGNLGLAGLVPPGRAPPPRWSGVPTPEREWYLGRGRADTSRYTRVRWESRVPLRRQKKQRHVPMVPVLDGCEAKCRGEGRGSEKQRTLGSEGGKRDRKREQPS